MAVVEVCLVVVSLTEVVIDLLPVVVTDVLREEVNGAGLGNTSACTPIIGVSPDVNFIVVIALS